MTDTTERLTSTELDKLRHEYQFCSYTFVHNRLLAEIDALTAERDAGTPTAAE